MSNYENHEVREPIAPSFQDRVEFTVGRLVIGGAIGVPIGIAANLVSEAIGIKPSAAGIVAPMVITALAYNRNRAGNSPSEPTL